MTEKVSADKQQIERFRETARQLGCDDDEKAFDEKLKVIARQKPTSLPVGQPSDPASAKK